MTSEVEEARHEQTMPNEERAEPIELGLRGRERDFEDIRPTQRIPLFGIELK